MLSASFSVCDHSAVIPTYSVAQASGAGSLLAVLLEAAWAPLQQELMNMLQEQLCPPDPSATTVEKP